jgi:hypothetical protein
MNTHSYQGGCHCQDARFEIDLQQSLEKTEITACNCSICEKTGFLHLIIPKSQFSLKTSWDNLSNYQFNKKIANHYFCKQCGIKSFYQPRSHPDYWSVNVRCLDDFSKTTFTIKNFDGKNWEQNIHTLK